MCSRAYPPYVLLALTACAHVPRPLPPITLTDVEGRPALLFDGQPRAVAFLATYCLPCVALIPELTALQTRTRDRGLSVVAVFLDTEGVAVVRPFVEHAQPAFPVLIADADFAAGRSPVGLIPELPALLFLDGQGRPVASVSGLAQPAQLDAAAALALR